MIPTFDRENYHMEPSDKSHVRNSKHDSYKDMLKKAMSENAVVKMVCVT